MRQTKKWFQIVLSLLLLTAAPLLYMRNVSALTSQLNFRSVAISTSIPGAVISETYGFDLTLANPVGSIVFEHCSNSALPGDPCVAPVGFNASGRNLTAQTGNTGFAVDSADSTVNKIVITRPSVAGALTHSTYGFTNITNTTVSGQTIFVRIATYASTDGTGPTVNAGSVAYSVQGGFSVGAYVPPFLIFCVGITVGPSCSSATGSLISFGELSTVTTKYATSQFSGATNDPGGYQVFVDGHTMTAGNQVITPLDSGGTSVPGTNQFGFNLRGNTNPFVGADQTGVGTAAVSSGYNTPNNYRMVTGEQLTNSLLSTDFNITTVSYVVNISNAQAPGSYATTLAYIATAAF